MSKNPKNAHLSLSSDVRMMINIFKPIYNLNDKYTKWINVKLSFKY